MPRRKDNVCKYVVKFGLGHTGKRLDYQLIFGPLKLRSLEVATTQDGVHCILITTEKSRSRDNIEQVIKVYNDTPEAVDQGTMDLVCVSDWDKETILTFSRSVMYFAHDFYKLFQFEQAVDAVTPGCSSYWCWNSDGSHLQNGAVLRAVNKKRVKHVKVGKKKAVKSELPPCSPLKIVTDEWTEFHELSANLYASVELDDYCESQLSKTELVTDVLDNFCDIALAAETTFQMLCSH